MSELYYSPERLDGIIHGFVVCRGIVGQYLPIQIINMPITELLKTLKVDANEWQAWLDYVGHPYMLTQADIQAANDYYEGTENETHASRNS